MVFTREHDYFPIEHTQLSEGILAPNCCVTNIPGHVLPISVDPLSPFTTMVMTPPLLHSRLNVWAAA